MYEIGQGPPVGGYEARLMDVAACYEQPIAKTFIPISLAESMTNAKRQKITQFNSKYYLL